ncbi:MAG: family 20 glycosylhydrolase [Clostridia bacterium]|nr:family 20 glycosylhydrolase [Clostridia bacterium]
MIFHPENCKTTEGSFLFSNRICATAHPCLNKEILREFWHNFTFQASTLSISETDGYVFSLGSAEALPLDGCDYSIHVEKGGVFIAAKSEQALINGFMTLLDRFKAVDTADGIAIELECCQIRDRARIRNRMIHFCVFPELALWELQRFVRLCGALKYTHVVLEFWGMLQYDCLKELSWSHGFTKEQIRPIIAEANALGMEVIPMFNHWGHATASRVMHGKHVVLDQNPSLQTYFSEDGWCWDIRKPKVRELLRQIRTELIELCGEGEYFHIGCDEAYNFEFTQENMDTICGFINGLSDELKAQGRRTLIWGDMLLYRHPHYNPKNRYSCHAPSPEVAQYLLDHVSKDVIIADWQYHSPEAPIETASVFKEAGFDCLLCPWDEGIPHIPAALSTIRDLSLMGFMHTTWHTLSMGTFYITMMAVGGFEDVTGYKADHVRPHTAALLRKVMPACGDYEKAGWSKLQVGFKW